MTLLVDTFWTEAAERLTANGWVIVDGSRYDPTVINGITPSGRAFTFTAQGDTVTITVAGRSRSITRSRTLWEPGDQTVTAMVEARNLLPASQR